MSWNIFKRIAQLEQKVTDLTDINNDHSRWFCRIEEKVKKLENANQHLVNSNQALIGRHENIGKRLANLEHQVYMQSRQLNPYSAAPVHSEGAPVFTKDEVDLEVSQEKEKKRQYQREWYAKNKASKAAKAKKNAYARAYYARTKGAKNA